MDLSRLNEPPGDWGPKKQQDQVAPKPEVLRAAATSAPVFLPRLPDGTPKMREDEIGDWNLDSAMCCICQGVVPHDQLSVCMKPSCCYAYGAMVYPTPTDFFNRVKVFCGQCTLYRNHSEHRDHMKQALPLAIETSSHMTGETLAEKYREVAVMNQSRLVDFVLMSEFKTENLEVPKIAKYLSNSNTTSEWNKKKEQVEKFLLTLENNRIAGLDYVKRLAEESVKSYKQLIQDTKRDTVQKLKERDHFEFQQAEHKAKMCENEINERDVEAWNAAHSGFSNMERASSRSSIAPSCSSRTPSRTASVCIPISVRVEAFEEDTPPVSDPTTPVHQEPVQPPMESPNRFRLPPGTSDRSKLGSPDLVERLPTPPSPPTEVQTQNVAEPIEKNNDEASQESDESTDSAPESCSPDDSAAEVTMVYQPKKFGTNGILSALLFEYDDIYESKSEEETRKALIKLLDGMTDDANIRKAVCDLFKSTTNFSLHPNSS